MRYLVFSDIHWNTVTSIVSSRGIDYSNRLQRLIKSMNWINRVAVEEKCDAMICAGDFFDKSQITDEQITALNDIKWNDLPCKLLCGNHESSVSDLRYSMLYALSNEKRQVINRPLKIDDGKCEICFLPYITESDKQPLESYFGPKSKKRIIISHNDIAGIMYGFYENKLGFSIKEIEENCDLYLNGHLHNTSWVSKKILNVGSFSAHNFTNDSEKYSYGAWILDTDTSNISFIENPCGYNFYKIDIETRDDLVKLYKLKDHQVLSIKCKEEILDDLNTVLDDQKNWIEASRVTVIRNISLSSSDSADIKELQGTDHIQKLDKFCHEKIDNTTILDEELAIICK